MGYMLSKWLGSNWFASCRRNDFAALPCSRHISIAFAEKSDTNPVNIRNWLSPPVLTLPDGALTMFHLVTDNIAYNSKQLAPTQISMADNFLIS